MAGQGLMQGTNSFGVGNGTALGVSAASGIISGIGNAYAGFAAASGQKAMLAAQQYALRKQAEVRMLQNQRQQKYMNESAANQYWQLGRERDIALGSQKAAAASQGFAGDSNASLYTDTINKYDVSQAMVARNLQLNAFEANIATASDVTNLISNANIAGIQRSGISAGANALAGGMSSFLSTFSNSLGIMGGIGPYGDQAEAASKVSNPTKNYGPYKDGYRTGGIVYDADIAGGTW